MRIILSPAKRMIEDTDSLAWRDLPVFLSRTQEILDALRGMDGGALKALWKCNDAIAAQNEQRVRGMDLHKNLTPAILAYDGIAFKYMAPEVFTNAEYDYVQARLRILSGFYGALRPFDGVTPYRLEMQAKLSVGGAKDLYAYWGGDIAANIWQDTDCVVNLASKEYSICVSKYVPKGARMVTCVFGEEMRGKVIEKGTMCKMARGEMVRFMASNGIKKPDDVRAFDGLGYAYSAEHSDENTVVFIRNPARRADEF